MAIDFNEARELFEKSSATELLQACDEDEIIRKIAEEVDGVEEDCVEECVDDLIQGEYLFPNDMELQRELVEANLSISETYLYARTDGSIAPEAFKQAVRSELDSCFNLYSTHIGSPVDSRVLDLCEYGLTWSEFKELFDKADFVERLSLAAEFHDKECKYRAYTSELCTSVPGEVITSMMKLEDLNLDAAVGALDLVEEKPELVAVLSEFDYKGSELFDTLQSIAASSNYDILLRSIESGVITNKAALDKVLKPAAGLGAKASRRI